MALNTEFVLCKAEGLQHGKPVFQSRNKVWGNSGVGLGSSSHSLPWFHAELWPGVHAEFCCHGSGQGVDCASSAGYHFDKVGATPEVSPDEKFQQTKNQGSPEGGHVFGGETEFFGLFMASPETRWVNI